MLPVLECVCFLWTSGKAVSAADASARVEHDFGFGMYAFGVLAPEAAEGAAFEEDGCSDAGSVMD